MILVTGGSGFIGRHLVRRLVGEGMPVRVLVRSDDAAARVPDGAETVRGDLADPESLAPAAAGCELVYHLAGAYRGSAAAMRSSHVAGTARLLRAVDPDCRFVHMSSTSVYGWDQSWPADHGSPPRPTSAYGKAKLAAERLVLARTTGQQVVCRPTITYGPGDEQGMLARAFRLMTRGVGRFPGTGRNRIHLTAVDDLVAGLLLLAVKGDGIYVLAGPSATPVERLFSLLALGGGLRAPRFGVPVSVVRPLARALDAAWPHGEPPLSTHSVDVLTRDRAYASTRAEDELGWAPQVPVEDGVPAYGRWLAERTAGGGSKRSAAAVATGNATSGQDDELGFDWRGYVEDADEGLGTVYERFALRDVLRAAVERTGATSVLHAPLFGMMGFPGLDAVFLAQDGVRVGLLDFSPERLEAVTRAWHGLGLTPQTHLVSGPDPTTWPQELADRYDLVFSFAALWWFDDPWAVLEAQARMASKGVLSCVPNKNVFLRVRARLWHQGLFDRLNERALDRAEQVVAAERLGLRAADTGLFDVPPFPDTSVPIAKLARALLGRRTTDEEEGGAWRWSILPYLHGEQPDLEGRIAKLAAWERYVPGPVTPALAHHRYTLFLPAT